MVTVSQVRPFLDAMHNEDQASIYACLAENIVLKSPIFQEPFSGRDTVIDVLMALLESLDEFEAIDVLTGDDHFGVFLKIRLADTLLDGMDYMHVDDAGLVNQVTIMWRPLPAVVTIQNALAPKLGVPALSLVPQA